MIETVMTTPRLHLTAWHLPLCKSYLAQQFIDLKQCLEQKSNQFFLRYIHTYTLLHKNYVKSNVVKFKRTIIHCSTWLTAILSYNPTWVFSVMPKQPQTSDQDEVKLRDLMEPTSFYNAYDAQKLDLCGQFQEAKFLITASNDEKVNVLKSLVFATSYFIRCSVIRRKKLVRLNRLREKHFKTKRIMVNRGNKKSDDCLEGVMFLLGENEKLVQQGATSSSAESSENSFEEEGDALSYLKVSLPK